MITDKETLELSELCSALIDEALTEQQGKRLSELLTTSEEARQFYVRMTGQSASLFFYAGEMQSGAPDATPKRGAIKAFTWITTTFALAASLAILAWVASPWLVRSSKAAELDPQFVARLTGAKNCEWVNASQPLGGRFWEGETMELATGYAEITFDSGARVILQGPATLTANSAWSATLTRGTLKAMVPPQAVGFSVANSAVKVDDFGAEFVMAAGSTTDLLVLRGQVEATSEASSDLSPVLLNANESRRFTSMGISAMPESALSSEQWAHVPALERYETPNAYAHWSFDEPVGTTFAAESVGLSAPASALEIRGLMDPAAASLMHVKGHVEGGFQFDGKLYARIPYPTISNDIPHTVAFWVKVPRDASLSNAYAMAAWNPNHKTVGFHPIHISWNRSPDEGVVGALRTDYGRGFAMGATPLRDNRWHHIAVIVIPPDGTKNFMEVKQYVDGRLEGEGNISPSGSEVFDASNDDAPPQGSAGALWLGARLGIKSVRTERFRGSMDELFVFDRPLEPQEIDRVMTMNHP